MSTNPLRCVVIGSGAVGTLLAVTLTRTGNDVVLLGRPGRDGRAERRRVRLDTSPGGRMLHVDLPVDRRKDSLEADVVVTCVPGHELAHVVAEEPELFGAAQTIVGVQGGIPWWYFSGTRGVYAGRSLASVDPNGAIARVIPVERFIAGALEGTVVRSDADGYGGARIGLVLGEIDGATKPRTDRLGAAFTAGTVQAVVTPHIRTALWRSLISDVAIEPLSALTHATPREMCVDDVVRGKLADGIREAMTVAAALEIMLGTSAEAELARRGSSAHIPPMLRDLLAGRPLEIEPLTGAVLEIGRMTKAPTPTLQELDAMVRLTERSSAVRRAEGAAAAARHASEDRFALPV